MGETRARPIVCYRCGVIEDFPILLHIVETGSGPGGMLYGCHACARQQHERHMAYCPTCARNKPCEISQSMAELILAARKASQAQP